ncbi:MAG TPA: Gfo/Idh/MocA family oxidoreductase [Methylomirabilota bacterium]|jgi:predicted dehydrogenase|nr:Gfo/Idh/MocA family oxidoreductase [Methylomirabilota bacterium]
MTAKLRVGVIGTGFGSTVQIPAFRAHPRVEVVAVASGQPGKARKVADAFGVAHAFDAWADLITADLDLVSITTPPSLHRAMALAAATARRHVLCEKPMALSTAEAAAMLAAVEQAGVRHVIDHELRFNPNRRKVRALIAEGFVGQPRHVLVTQVGPGRADPSRPWTWWSDAARGGGLLGALGSHQIDLLRYWLGEVERVVGTAEAYIKERPDPDGRGQRRVTADDCTTFTLRFASGALATVLLSSVTAHARGPRLEVWGDEGTLVLDDADRLWGGRQGREPEELTEPETLTPAPGMDYVPLWGLSFRRLVDHLVTAVLDGGPLTPAATFADGLAVQRIMDAIRASAATWPVVPRD